MILFDKKIKDCLLSSKEVAAMLNLSEKTAVRYLEENIPAVKMGRSFVSSVECLRWYVVQNANKALLLYLQKNGVDVYNYLHSFPVIKSNDRS